MKKLFNKYEKTMEKLWKQALRVLTVDSFFTKIPEHIFSKS